MNWASVGYDQPMSRTLRSKSDSCVQHQYRQSEAENIRVKPKTLE